jgi:hypothetical protein
VMVSVSTSSNKLSYGEAFLTLTTHRVLFRFESPGIEKTCQHIPLSAILSYEVPKSSLFHRPTHVTLTLCNGITIELNFTSGGRKHFVEQLSLTRSKRSWVCVIVCVCVCVCVCQSCVSHLSKQSTENDIFSLLTEGTSSFFSPYETSNVI